MQNVNRYPETRERLQVLNGAPAAQELHDVLSRHLPSLHRQAHRFLGNSADAEDAVQDALLAAYTHLDQFRGRSQMSTWLTAIVHNSARMQLRARLGHVHVSLDEPVSEDSDRLFLDRLTDGAPTPEHKCRDSELNNRLRRLLAQLSPSLRKTFQLRTLEGLSIRETAATLGVPPGTVKARLARARKTLKQLMPRALTPRTRRMSNKLCI